MAAEKNRSLSMRGKEEAHDYRYFPDPDLLPLVIDKQWVAAVKKSLPELPEARKQRFTAEYGLPAYDAELLTADRDLADYFEACLQRFADPKQVSNWIMGPLLALLNAQNISAAQSPVAPEQLADLLKLADAGTVSAKTAKSVFEEMAASGKPPATIVEQKGLVQVSDAAAIEAIIDKVLDAHPQEVAAYRGGKSKLLGFFVGQVMRETRGKANPQVVNQILKDMLDR